MFGGLKLLVLFSIETTGGRGETGNSLGKTVGVIAGSVALVVMIIVGIGCYGKKTRNRKLKVHLSKR